MKLFHHSAAPDPSPPAPGPDRLAGVRPVVSDDEDRPSREDRGFGQTIFTRPPVPLPRLLTGRRGARPK